MEEDEVIIVDGISDADYDSLIMDCVKYAIISLPFTVNRMNIQNDRRVLNIAKGKIAEAIFNYFCQGNGIHPDFKVCATPFWEVDKRDFVLKGNEWDIKNNFYYCVGTEYKGKYTDFPALIPNRFDGDQWSKRDKITNPNLEGVEFLFTFLKAADLVNGKRKQEFLEINLSDEQMKFISDLYIRYQGKTQQEAPFTEEKFWAKFESLGGMNLFTLYSRPSLVITAYANKSHWDKFKNTGPNVKYRNDDSLHWYKKSEKALCFLNGTIWTKITNSTCRVSQLPSFLSLYPQLQKNIVYGHVRSSATR